MVENPAATIPQTQSTVVRGGRDSAVLEGSWRGVGGELEVMALPPQHTLPIHSYSVGTVSGLTGTSIHVYNSVP